MLPTLPHEVIVTLVEWMGVIAVTILLSISPAVKSRRPVAFKYTRREVIVSLGLFLLVWIAAFVYASGAISRSEPQIMPALDASPYTGSDLLDQALISAIFAAPFLLAILIRRQPWLSVGLGKANNRIGWQFGAGLGLITIFLTGKTYQILDGFTADEGYYLLACLAMAFSMEFIFRGFIQLRLVNRLGENGGWLATAGLFTLWRIPALVFRYAGDPVSLIWSLLLALGMGLMLGWIMRKTGSVLATGLYHAIHLWAQIL